MAQTNRLPVRMQFASLLAAIRTSGALKRALDRHRQIAAIKASVKHADVRQIQWDFNQSWHRLFLLKLCCCLTADLVIGETRRASHAKQSIEAHKILWVPRELWESHCFLVRRRSLVTPPWST